MNTLYYGDNLDILRRYVADESVDLVYLDPPFNSAQNYNVLFAEQDGSRSAAQIQAFEDTWRWDQAAAHAFQELVEGGGQASLVMQAFRQAIGENDMLAYLAMMAPRLVELRRVLKPTGSLFLHCDQTASHYLKVLLDSVFGPANFRSEIIWKRTTSHNDARRNFGVVSDCIFYCVKTEAAPFFRQFKEYDPEYLESKYRHTDSDGRTYRLSDMRSPHPRPN
jgi:site-specific DNA-methyltransferase (adenine-specific)